MRLWAPLLRAELFSFRLLRMHLLAYKKRPFSVVVCCIVMACLISLSAFAQQRSKMNMDVAGSVPQQMQNADMQTMLPMPFFTHMGLPFAIGTYGVRIAVLPTQIDGAIKTAFNFQCETGLSKTVGLFLGGDGLFDAPTLEAMFQFLALKSNDGMSGFSPIIEFEFPTMKDAPRRLYTLVGIATTISSSTLACNQVLHYSPLEDLGEGSVSLLLKASQRIFLISEISGVVEQSAGPIFNLLVGVKIKIAENVFVGFAYQLPLTENRDFSSRYVFQPNVIIQQ